jgi:hypothetical protein
MIFNNTSSLFCKSSSIKILDFLIYNILYEQPRENYVNYSVEKFNFTFQLYKIKLITIVCFKKQQRS